MMIEEIAKIAINGALVCYSLAFVFYLLYNFLDKKNRLSVGYVFLILGLIMHTVSIITRWLNTGNPPFATLYETMVFFSWSVLTVSLFTGLIKVSETLTAVLPLVTLGIASFIKTPHISHLPPILEHPLLSVHVATCLIGYAAFGISFVLSIIYLIRRDVIFRNKIDTINYKIIGFGILALGVGIVLGSIWGKQAWGRYWSWDPKETWALITWVIYGLSVITRAIFGWAGKKFAWVSVFGFLILIFSWFGVNYLLKGLHSYG